MANKKAANKTPVAKKTAPKKAAAKPVAKKAPVAIGVKKSVNKAAASKANTAATKKVVAKPALKKSGKAVPAKKAISKSGTVIKKTPAKKAATAKPVTKRGSDVKNKSVVKPATAISKKQVPVKAKQQSPANSQEPIPTMASDDDTVAKAANIQDENKPAMIVPGADPVKVSDPLLAFDKHTAEKAMSKGDPHSKLKYSSKPKNAIKPSGKKPLW